MRSALLVTVVVIAMQPDRDGAVNELRNIAALVGSWSGESTGRDGARRVDLVFRSLLDGRLIEGDYSSTYEGQPLRQRLSITYDAFRREYRCAVADNIFGLLDIYEGSRTGNRLVMSNQRAATTGKTAYRFTLDIAPEKVVMDTEVLPPGKDWRLESRVVLRRQ